MDHHRLFKDLLTTFLAEFLELFFPAKPVASALMTKMNFAIEDRPYVKLECLRKLATLKMNPAKMSLIGGFMNSYLKLTSAEAAAYN